MTTLTNLARFSSVRSNKNNNHAPDFLPSDFVSSDSAALASHMSHCASTRSRYFGLHAALESAHSLIFPRMVTAAVIALVLVGLVGIV